MIFEWGRMLGMSFSSGVIYDQKRSNPMARFDRVAIIEWPDGLKTPHYRRRDRSRYTGAKLREIRRIQATTPGLSGILRAA